MNHDSEKHALVTGASEGIGRSFAKKLSAEGYSVTAVARNEERLIELIREMGPRHHYIVTDLTQEDGINRISHELHQKHFTLLVNNAGFGVYEPFYLTSLQKTLKMLRLNCEAMVSLCHEYLKTAAYGDAIINISSTLSFLPFPKGGVYAATKSFVTSFSESLWFEQKKRGIYVMAFCPGATESEFHKRAGGKENEIPKIFLQTSNQVVQLAFNAFKKRKKPTVVSGPLNHFLTSFHRVLSRRMLVTLMGQAQ